MAGLPGYPSNQQLAAQAASAAGAAVPTLQSINQQYGQSMADTRGFTNALVSLLRGGPNPGAGYMNAEAAQAGIDNAAASRLAALGGQYGAQSAAAVHGMGDSALGGLLQRGAAASAYGAKMPAVAAGRGQLLQQGLVTAKHQAITQRGQEYAQAYQQALQQARQNGLALSQLGLSQKQLAFQEKTQNQNNAYRYAALQQNQNQFNASQAQQFQEFQANLAAQLRSGSASGVPSGWTPTQIRAAQATAFKYVNDPTYGVAEGGMRIQQAIQNLVQQGIPRTIAIYEANQGYANLQRPPKAGQGHFVSYDKNGARVVTAHDKANAKAALSAYNTAMRSFRTWVNHRLYHSTIANQRSQGTAPGQGRGIG